MFVSRATDAADACSAVFGDGVGLVPQDVLGNPISIDDSAETLSRVLDAKASVVKGEKPQLQVTPATQMRTAELLATGHT
jgi:hypothetical protein